MFNEDKEEKPKKKRRNKAGLLVRAIRGRNRDDIIRCGWDWRAKSLRASQIYDVCPRQAVFGHQYHQDNHEWPVNEDVKINFTSDTYMNNGTDLHRYFQEDVIGPSGYLRGKWVCRKCQVIQEGYYPKECDCGSDLGFAYEEYTMIDDELGVSGHIDGEIDISRMNSFVATGDPNCSDEPDMAILEVKTTNSRNFDKLIQAPMDFLPPYYRMQASVYQHMRGIPKTLFLYMERDGCRLADFTYVGESSFLRMAREKMKSIRAGIKGEDVMGKCVSINDKDAKSCPFREKCFGV